MFYAPLSVIFKQKGTEIIIKGHFGASIDFIYLIAKEQQSVRFENASGILMQEIMRKDDCVWQFAFSHAILMASLCQVLLFLLGNTGF